MRKTGRKPVSCKCQTCKSQCMRSPCLGTPQDIEKIIDAGYKHRIFGTIWATRVAWGFNEPPIHMYQALQLDSGCTFFQNGLCELHSKGLKPTEGRLSHHSVTQENYEPRKGLSYNVAKTWLDPRNKEVIARITNKMENNNDDNP